VPALDGVGWGIAKSETRGVKRGGYGGKGEGKHTSLYVKLSVIVSSEKNRQKVGGMERLSR
jgi:hypothetical protein